MLPLHPGEPQWKTREEWLKTRVPVAIEIPISNDQSRDSLLKKFRLKDDCDPSWGGAPTESQGWGDTPQTGGWEEKGRVR
ncbi:hypothetical protein BDF14DRAFT_1886871 [Spinellus fusiger]|nr:hypothetical protein BDF14DRAFT_1886871 [Spinellus fusiger]